MSLGAMVAAGIVTIKSPLSGTWSWVEAYSWELLLDQPQDGIATFFETKKYTSKLRKKSSPCGYSFISTYSKYKHQIRN